MGGGVLYTRNWGLGVTSITCRIVQGKLNDNRTKGLLLINFPFRFYFREKQEK